MAQRFSIQEVNRARAIAVVGPGDFVRGTSSEIDAEEVLRNPAFSLYCIDRENDSVLFVEADDSAAVDAAPFYYQAQAEHAVGVVSMPIEEFHRLADEITMPPKGIILVHSVGRCGSTLLSKVLAAAPSVHSLSEPDDLTQVLNLCGTDRRDDIRYRAYLKSSFKWRCKARAGVPADRVAIKTRSEVLVLADWIGAILPTAHHLFLYRDGVSWMGSLFRGYSPERDPYDVEQNAKMAESWGRTLPLVGEMLSDGRQMNQVEIRMLAWITCMEAYLKLRAMCVPLCAARYEDIVASPQEVLGQLLEFCEISDVPADSLREVLDRDSQAGTVYDREVRRKLDRKLTDSLVQDINNLVAMRPLLGTPGVILPGTVRLD